MSASASCSCSSLYMMWSAPCVRKTKPLLTGLQKIYVLQDRWEQTSAWKKLENFPSKQCNKITFVPHSPNFSTLLATTSCWVEYRSKLKLQIDSTTIYYRYTILITTVHDAFSDHAYHCCYILYRIHTGESTMKEKMPWEQWVGPNLTNKRGQKTKKNYHLAFNITLSRGTFTTLFSRLR